MLTITSRNPIYSALWFAMVVIATAGLFLLAGASFLAAGTIIVYAGAIIVTFLFVIMLAQMEGKAIYDRAARAPGPATFTCFLLFWCLIYSLSAVAIQAGAQTQPKPAIALARAADVPRAREFASGYQLEPAGSLSGAAERVLPPTSMISNAQSQREAERRRAGRVALHHSPGDRRAGRRVCCLSRWSGRSRSPTPKRPKPPAEA